MNDIPSLLSFLFQEPDHASDEAKSLKDSIPKDIYGTHNSIYYNDALSSMYAKNASVGAQ